MATVYWLGNNAGNEGNTDTGANYSGGSVPSAGDDLILNGNSAYPMTAFGGSGVALNRFIRTADCKVAVGSSATPCVKFTVSSGSNQRMNISGLAPFFWSGNVTNAEIAHTGGTDIAFVGGTVTTLRLGRGAGRVRKGASAVVTTVIGKRGSVYFDEGGTGATTATIRGATADFMANPATLNVYDGGRVKTRGSGTMTAVNIEGGRVNHVGSGTITTLNGGVGQLDGDGNGFPSVTITTANVEVDSFNLRERWPGGSFAIGTLNEFGDETGGEVSGGGPIGGGFGGV